MTRAEELVLKKADAGLESAEEAELDALLADPATAAACLALVEVEAGLRAGRTDGDLPDAVVAAARRLRDEGLEASVMQQVRAATPAWLPRRRSRLPWIGAVAAGTLLAMGLAFHRPPPPAIGRLADAPGDVLLERGTGAAPALPSNPLRIGDVLRSGSRPVEFVLDGVARVRMEPQSALVLEGARRIVLRQGEVDADVLPQPPGRPLVIEAPDARAEVLGTRLKLSAAADASRLEVRSGRVKWVRAEDGAEVVVSEKEFSIVGDGLDLGVRSVPPAGEGIPEVTGFSLILLDSPRTPIPGYEDLRDGTVIDLSLLPTRRVNLRANTRPATVGSLRFSTAERENLNTELIAPYTLVPTIKNKERVWNPAAGLHTITATPFTGTYGNGERGTPRTITFTVVP